MKSMLLLPGDHAADDDNVPKAVDLCSMEFSGWSEGVVSAGLESLCLQLLVLLAAQSAWPDIVQIITMTGTYGDDGAATTGVCQGILVTSQSMSRDS